MDYYYYLTHAAVGLAGVYAMEMYMDGRSSMRISDMIPIAALGAAIGFLSLPLPITAVATPILTFPLAIVLSGGAN